MTKTNRLEVMQACPFCGSNEHLSISMVGSLTSDMPDRPYRVLCLHIDHDTVQGPVAYGRGAAITAWNTRPIETNTRTGDTGEGSGEPRVIVRAAKCGHHFNADCDSCQSALEWTNRQLDDLRAQSITPPEGGELERVAQMAAFLIDRIDELDWCGDLESFANEWNGHVDPPLSRLREALAQHRGSTL